ncbi:MAG: CpsD/CapB family tyrosine-protein kinase [Gammaproteobacteria bacterium]
MKLSKSADPTKTGALSGDALKKDNLIIATLKNHPASEIVNILRTKILSKMDANHWNVLAVTSPRANAGKSFTASNLAISIAMEENHSALLVDFDFRRPSIHSYFGLPSKKGLSDFVHDDVPLSELLIRPNIKRLALLPAGKQTNGSLELLSSPKLLTLLSELKNRYSDRIIVVDLPPLLDTADALTFLPNADACLLVIAEGECTVEDVKQSLQLVDKDKLLGTVLNKSTETMAPMYY